MPLFFDKGNISDIRFGFFMTKINAVYWKENGNARNEYKIVNKLAKTENVND